MPSLLGRHDITGAIARFWQTSYAADYIGLLALVILDGLIQTFVEPFHRLFRLDTQAIHFPHASVERVPVGWLFVFGLGVPVLVFIFYGLTFKPSLHKLHVTLLGLIISLTLTVFVTDVLKNAIGRPRPDLRDRCNAAKDTPVHELITVDTCMQIDAHLLHDGWRSFPSGHSSFAFSGLGFLSLFFAGQFHILHPGHSLPTQIFTFTPVFGALLIAISRCEDYRHDVYDVTAGSLLGLFITYMTYRRYYPSLTSSRCETPYPSRADMTAAGSRWNGRKPRDEEAYLGLPTPRGNGNPGHNPPSSTGGSRTIGPDVIGTVDSDDDVEKGRERSLLRGTTSPQRTGTPR